MCRLLAARRLGVACLAAMLAWAAPAAAQSTCNMAWFAYKYTPTSIEWVSCWNSKQNALGYTPLNAASNLSDLNSAAAARTNLGITSVGTAAPGQVPGTATNDNAAAGDVGEHVNAITPDTTATVTITIASPAVVSWTAHGLGAGSVVEFTTTGALPTGLSTATPYYVIAAGLTANAFEVSATPFGTAVVTTGTQSGTQTATSAVPLTTATAANVAAIQLTAGDWDVSGSFGNIDASSTVETVVQGAVTSTSATFPASFTSGYAIHPTSGLTGAAGDGVYPVGTKRFSLSVTTIVYLVVQETFTTSTASGYGFIRARRVR